MYAEIKDIERLMAQWTLNTTSRPNHEQVQSIIDDVEAEVNSVLAGAYVKLPITDTTFAGWLRIVVSYGATAAILKSMFPSATGPGETPAYAFWESRYNTRLKGIETGVLLPPSIDKEPKHKVKPATYFTRNPNREENLGEIAEPFFKREQRL